MNNYDSLYNLFRESNEQRKRRNFNAFMDGFLTGMDKDLDKYYATDREKYEQVLNNVKSMGIRVFRNSAGKHKLIPIGNEPKRPSEPDIDESKIIDI